MDIKISCIIPVYNEGKRVKKVLDAVIGHELVDEIIVVNDGSTDDSEKVLKEVDGIKLISYKKNRGKTGAVKAGFEESKNDLVMMIDSDLVGLKKIDITALIEPIKEGSVDITMTMRKNSLMIFKLFGLDFISGERVFRKSIIEDFNDLDKLPGFGLESFLNRILIKKKMRLKVVKWKNVVTPRKSVKFGWWKGTKGDIKMIKQIISVLGVSGIYKQYRKMLSLKV